MTAKGEKVYAYLLLDVLVDPPEGLDATGHIPSVTEGEIVLRWDYPGNGTHAFTFEDGPVKLRATGVYVTTGQVSGSGEVSFDYGAQRLLNLVKIGQENETVMREQLHEFAEAIRNHSEDKLNGPLTRAQLGAWIGSLAPIEARYVA